MKALVKLALAASMAAVFGGTAIAHHSYAMYEKRMIKLEGTIKEFQWTNPHIFLQVMAPDETGQIVEWSFEGGGPGQLARQGWKFNSLKTGDKVEIGYAPLRDGSHAGGLIFVQVKGGARFDGGPLASLDLEHAPAEGK